jgi:class 3 adenylate cyclase
MGSPTREQLEARAGPAEIARGAPKHFGSDTADGQRVESQSRDAASLVSFQLALSPIERRLAAILATDVAGSCRLIGIDEEGMLAQLKALRKMLFDPKVTDHRGRIVKNTGDGALVEFASVVDAVRCADEIQRSVAEQNTDVPRDKRIEFRIGIHVGDIITEPSAPPPCSNKAVCSNRRRSTQNCFASTGCEASMVEKSLLS